MKQEADKPHTAHRGSALISAVVFTLITSVCLAGMGTLAVSHYSRANVESNYAEGLGYAEAGINYELRKISENPASADQAGGSSPPGVSYSFGDGSYRVYCMNKDGTTPWSPSQYLYVVASGTRNGTTRTIQVSIKGFPQSGNYAIYTMNSLSVWRGTAINILGDVGTNSELDFSGSPNISGTIFFNGPDADWYGGIAEPGYTTARNPRAVEWPTVAEVALEKFPASTYPPGGLAYLANNNSNALASPPIVGRTINDTVTLRGPGDYYVESLNLTGSKKIILDNTNGPINLWIGPEGGTSLARFRGGTAAVSATSDPTKACSIFVATRGGIDLAGNERLDALLYGYNEDSSGNAYGRALNSGNPVINGQILVNDVDINGNVTVNYVAGGVKPTGIAYYGYDNSWQEINPVNR